MVPIQLDYHCIDSEISGQGRVSAKSTGFFYLRSILPAKQCQKSFARQLII